MENLARLKTEINYYKNYNSSTYKSKKQRQNDLADDLSEILKYEVKDIEDNAEESVVDVNLSDSQLKEIQDKSGEEGEKESAEDCEEECNGDCCLEFEVREESLKSDILSLAFDDLILDNDCEIVRKPQDKLSDEAVERLALLLNKGKFANLSDEDAQFLLSNFVADVCDYIGIKLPTVECKSCENEEEIENEASADFNLSYAKQDAKDIKERCSRSELKEFTLEITEPIYGESGYENALFLTYFSKEFFNNVNAVLGVKKNVLQKYSQPEYLTTVRHECQHLYQFAKIRDYFNGKNVEPKYKIMALTEVMQRTLLDYMEENDIYEFEYEMASYKSNCLEIDARHSEFVLLKSLIEDDRLSEHNKRVLKKHIIYLLDEFLLQSKQLKNINALAKLRITSLKFEFEKEFGHLPLAKFLISELNAINLDAYAKEIESYEQMYKLEYEKLAKEKTIRKELAKEQKKVNKIDKLNVIYEL